MKALSITQPYAELIKNGTKTIETRSWKTNYRGVIYIHASSTKIPKASKENAELMRLTANADMDFGRVICSAELVDCVKMTESYIENLKATNYNEFVSGIYEKGRYAWILENVKVLDEPAKAKGQLGLWDFEPTKKGDTI